MNPLVPLKSNTSIPTYTGNAIDLFKTPPTPLYLHSGCAFTKLKRSPEEIKSWSKGGRGLT